MVPPLAVLLCYTSRHWLVPVIAGLTSNWPPPSDANCHCWVCAPLLQSHCAMIAPVVVTFPVTSMHNFEFTFWRTYWPAVRSPSTVSVLSGSGGGAQLTRVAPRNKACHFVNLNMSLLPTVMNQRRRYDLQTTTI